MAPLWLSLLPLLSNITMVIAQLPIQDGFPVNFWTSPQRRWEWKASDGGSLQGPLLLRRKREGGLGFQNSLKAVEGSTKKSLSEIPKPSPHTVATPETPIQWFNTISITVGTPQNTPKNRAPSQSQASNVTKEAKPPKDGPHLVSKKGPATSSKRTGSPTKGAIATTEYWPWLHDYETSAPTETLAAGMESPTVAPKRGTLEPVLEAKGERLHPSHHGHSPHPCQQPWCSGQVSWFTTTTDELQKDQSTVSAWMTGRERPRSRNGLSPHHRTTALSQTLMDEADTSAVTGRPSLGTVGTGSGAKGKGRTPLVTAHIPVGSPAAVGKCLLALSLLALVAGTFIVLTAVLVGLLWRQRWAYRMNQRNQTEMVCISSLLAAKEAEEGWAEGPRAQRVRMLQENGTEADNLTLNSFLPDH